MIKIEDNILYIYRATFVFDDFVSAVGNLKRTLQQFVESSEFVLKSRCKVRTHGLASFNYRDGEVIFKYNTTLFFITYGTLSETNSDIRFNVREIIDEAKEMINKIGERIWIHNGQLMFDEPMVIKVL